MPKYTINPETSSMTEIHSFEIEIEYAHNLKELYKRLYFWLDDNGWQDIHGRSEYEVRYWQRDLPGDRQEHHIWWRAYRESSTPLTKNEFFKYFLKIDYQTINSKSKEVMHQGKKWKLSQTNTIMRVSGYLIKDFDKQWSTGLLSQFKNVFENWIYKDKIQEEEERAYKHIVELQNQIKDFLELRKDKDVSPNIYPPNMLPR